MGAPKGSHNNPNLRKINSEQAREMAKKSAEVRREKRDMQKELMWLLDLPLYEGKGSNPEDIKALASAKGKNITTRQAVMIAQLQKAIKGDTTSAVFLRDTVGEKPAEKIEVDQSVTIENYAKTHTIKI